MKTYFLYGLAMALAGAFLALILFFLGFHSDPAKLSAGQTVGFLGGIVIGVVCLVLGMKARRAERPATEAFTYGRALAAGTMIVLFATLLGTAFNLLYITVINPDYTEVMVQSQIATMEEKGTPPEQIDQAEGVLRMMSSPVAQTISSLIVGFLGGFILALIVAIFLRRPAAVEQPPPMPT